MVKSRDNTFAKPGVREETESLSCDGSLGSGLLKGGKIGENVSSASGEVALDKKFAETISETGLDKESGQTIASSNNNFSGCSVVNGKSTDLCSPNGSEKVAAKQVNIRPPLPETKEIGGQAVKTDHKTVSRLAASKKDARSFSPGAETRGPNKRPAIICDFYAKGWCIKGSSCRFLHIKDNQKNDLLQQKKGAAPTDCKMEVQLEGLRSGSPSVRDPTADSPLDRIQPLELAESKGSNNFPEIPKLLQGEELLPLSFKDTKKNGFVNDNNDHEGALRDRFPLESAVSSGHRFGNQSSHSRSVEELARFQHQRPLNYQIPPLKSNSPGSSSSIPLSTTGVLSSNGISAWTGSSLPFSYSSLSASKSPSLLHNPSQVSGSKLDNLPPSKRKFSLDNWEPSVPFRPSILLRSMVSLPEIDYDPLRDSVELPKVGDLSLKAFSYGHGSSIVNTSNYQNNGEPVSENRGLACTDETMSVSSHNTHHEKDILTSGLEVVGTSTGREIRTVPKRENYLGLSVIKDSTEATNGSRHKNYGHRDSLYVKVGHIKQNNQMDITEQTVNKESKALRQFRAALIDFVKESLKPKWREGHLTKDIHNKIVRKAVEKVLSTLPVEQIPTSMELTTEYLALSRSKINKLVEGYAEIYGKA